MIPADPKHLTASGFVLHPDHKILLVHHRKLKVWLYPGGHVEPNETPDECVVREILEESGIEARIIGERDLALEDLAAGVHALHTPYRVLCELIAHPTEPHYHIDMVYLCAAQDDACVANTEVHDARFFGRDEIAGLTLFPSFRTLLLQVFDDAALWRGIVAQEACA